MSLLRKTNFTFTLRKVFHTDEQIFLIQDRQVPKPIVCNRVLRLSNQIQIYWQLNKYVTTIQ